MKSCTGADKAWLTVSIQSITLVLAKLKLKAVYKQVKFLYTKFVKTLLDGP